MRVPITLTQLKTSQGHPVLKVTFEGEVTPAEAQAFHAKVTRGGEHFGCGHLVTGHIAGLSAEVRKILTSEKTTDLNPPPVAIVLVSALTRMVAGVAMRITENDNTDFFKNEPAALEWLEGRMNTFISKRHSER